MQTVELERQTAMVKHIPSGPPSWGRNTTTDTVRVYLIDDYPMFRRGLTVTLNSESSFNCVGEASSGAEAVRSVQGLQPDVVLIDMAMPGMDGIETMEALRTVLPQARFVLFLNELDAAELRRAIAAGAACVLLKSASTQELITAVRAVHCGLRVHSPALTDALSNSEPQAALGADLTRRERSLLVLMALGLTNKDISERLNIAMPTVKFHVTNILAKLNAENRTTAVLVALRHKIIAMDRSPAAMSS